MTTLPLMVAGGLGTWGGGVCKWGGTQEGLGTRLCQVPTAKRLIRWESGIQPPRRPSKSSSLQPACEGGLSLSPGQAPSLPMTGKKGTSRSPRFRKCKLPRVGGQAESLSLDAQTPRAGRAFRMKQGEVGTKAWCGPEWLEGPLPDPQPRQQPRAPRSCCCSSLEGSQSSGLPQTQELGEASGTCRSLALGHTGGLGFGDCLFE